MNNFNPLHNQADSSTTSVFRMVNPDKNDHTYITGYILRQMEEVAFMTATRFSRLSVAITSSDRLELQKQIPETGIIEIIGNVTESTNSILRINVRLYAEQMFSEARHLAACGIFTYAIIRENVSSNSSNGSPNLSIHPTFIGGERELRALLNIRLHPKTIARATLYNYLEKLKIRKMIYSEKDAAELMTHISTLKSFRKKAT